MKDSTIISRGAEEGYSSALEAWDIDWGSAPEANNNDYCPRQRLHDLRHDLKLAIASSITAPDQASALETLQDAAMAALEQIAIIDEEGF